jgi:activator of HSP90 ATPase
MTSRIVSRRAVTLGMAALPAGFSAAARASAASNNMGTSAPNSMGTSASAAGISHTAAAIHQEVVFDADRHRVYQALTEARLFDKVVKLSAAAASAAAPGAPPTQLASEAGGTFSLFGGYITGRQIELVADERVVQVWRAGSWEPAAYSIARFVLESEGGKTRLLFDHKGFPDDQAVHLATGWHINYWEPLAKFLAAG